MKPTRFADVLQAAVDAMSESDVYVLPHPYSNHNGPGCEVCGWLRTHYSLVEAHRRAAGTPHQDALR